MDRHQRRRRHPRRPIRADVAYPENLETIGNQYETPVDVHRGVVEEIAGNSGETCSHYERAIAGRNRAPECRYYAAKAYEKLGDTAAAESLFHRSLIESGEPDLDHDTTVDFFDPFSRQRSASERAAVGYVKMAFGHLGLNDSEQAGEYFARASEYNPALLNLLFSARTDEGGLTG